MTNIKRLRIRRTISGLTTIVLISIPTSALSIKDKSVNETKPYITTYEEKYDVVGDKDLWFDMSKQEEQKIKKKKRNFNLI